MLKAAQCQNSRGQALPFAYVILKGQYCVFSATESSCHVGSSINYAEDIIQAIAEAEGRPTRSMRYFDLQTAAPMNRDSGQSRSLVTSSLMRSNCERGVKRSTPLLGGLPAVLNTWLSSSRTSSTECLSSSSFVILRRKSSSKSRLAGRAPYRLSFGEAVSVGTHVRLSPAYLLYTHIPSLCSPSHPEAERGCRPPG